MGQEKHAHPCLEHHEIYNHICSPLQKLGVEFFGYTAVDTNNRAYCLGSKREYAKQYLMSEQARNDVHFRPTLKTSRLQYYFWDFANLSENSVAVYQLAHAHNQGHTLTITRQTESMTHCYHFSGHVHDDSINQRYLAKMDVLHTFMDYFDHSLKTIPEIHSVYDHPINIKVQTKTDPFLVIGDDPRSFQLNQATNQIRFKNFAHYYLTAKERTCLYWLHRGKSAPLIAEILQVSSKTVERYIASIKSKFNCYSLFQLGEKIFESGLSDLLDRPLE